MGKFATCYSFWYFVRDVLPTALLAHSPLYWAISGITCLSQPIPSIVLFKDKEVCEPHNDPHLDKLIKQYYDYRSVAKFEETYSVLTYGSPWIYNDLLARLFCDIERKLLLIQYSTLLPYPPSRNMNQPAELNEKDWHKKVKEMIPVFKLIYEFCFDRAISTFFYKDAELDLEPYWEDVSTTIEDIFNFIFRTYPSTIKYLDAFLASMSSSNGKQMLSNTPVKKFINDLSKPRLKETLWVQVLQIPLKLTDLLDFKSQKMFAKCESSIDLWKRYTKLYVDLYKLLENVPKTNLSNLESQFQRIVEGTYKVAEDFEEFYYLELHLSEVRMFVYRRINERQIDPDAAEFIVDTLKRLGQLRSMRGKILRYKCYLNKFDHLSKKFFAFFSESIKNILQQTTKVQKLAVWNAGYLNFDLYIWETAKLIETDPKASPIVTKYLREQLVSGNVAFYNRFILNYNSRFVGLLKSICDMTPEYWNSDEKVPEIDTIIQRIEEQECGMKDLIDLYLSFRQAVKRSAQARSSKKEGFICDVSCNIRIIYNILTKRKICKLQDILEEKNTKNIMYFYAYQILKLNREDDDPMRDYESVDIFESTSHFSEKFSVPTKI